MSIVIAKKINGTVYMAADISYSDDTVRIPVDSETNFKIKKLSDRLLMGVYGDLRNAQLLNLLKNSLSGLKIKTLDYDAVRSLSVDVYGILNELHLLSGTRSGTAISNVTILFAMKDKLFLLDDSFGIHEIEDSIAIGHGSDIAKYDLLKMSEKDNPEQKMHESLDNLSKIYLKVIAPYVFIDTKNMKYKVVE